MVSAGAGWLPVVDEGRVVGIVAMNEVISGYQRALRRSLRLLADVTGSSVLVEAPVGEASPFAGATVATAPWPRGSFALSIDRHSQLIAPRPETAFQVGDVLVVVVPSAAEAELRRTLDGPGAMCCLVFWCPSPRPPPFSPPAGGKVSSPTRPPRKKVARKQGGPAKGDAERHPPVPCPGGTTKTGPGGGRGRPPTHPAPRFRRGSAPPQPPPACFARCARAYVTTKPKVDQRPPSYAGRHLLEQFG